MALYQKSVLNNYLNQLDKSKVDNAYKKYLKYFLNTEIQDNIRISKEEEYQGIFLIELFVNILDYTLKPNVNFNLVAEYKNQSNSRKADGAILNDNLAVAVIELKGTKTKDLESIRRQAFDYKVNHKECIYVITSNYEKLRFYINDATEFIEFNLFELNSEDFQIMYLCLHKDNILNNVPLRLKDASIVVEESITKQFYKDYSLFKRELFRDLVKRNAKKIKNSQISLIEILDDETRTEQINLEKNLKLTLFKKSQKLIDRFLFVFFAEDRGLLPPNSTIQILNKWESDVDFGGERPLYDMFKQYFRFLDTGRQGTLNRAEIYAYNGGLFKEDLLLDKLEIDSTLLLKHTKILASYDFESQVDVNILGHIFENSLNEIESVNAEIEGGEFDKQKSKRKKDGVFYTPKYITKYMVENTIGKLCEERKIELGFKEEEYFKGRKNRKHTTVITLVEKLDNYRDWLLNLTICDPACGSGAFLNQALDFLIKEHQYVDDLKAKVLGGSFVFSEIENTILENNIYGVDLNEESVEIAKLSLWLRTAQPRRKLNNLNSNIKCGNSLINSKIVAGDKAFDWHEQFPSVFKNGGFDVVLGNPPYVSNKEMHRNKMQDQIGFWNKNYISAVSGNYDLYILFVELGLRILKKSEYLSYIIPNKFLIAKYSGSILKHISENYYFEKIVDYSNINVFPDASVYPIIINIKKEYVPSEVVDRLIVEKGAFEENSIVRKWNYINLKFQDDKNLGVDLIMNKIELSDNLVNSDLSFEPGINGFQFTNYAQCVTDGKIAENSKKLTVTGNIDPYIFLNNVTRYKKVNYNEPFIRFEKNIISEGKWDLFCKPKIMIAGMTKRIEASLDLFGNYAPSVSVYSICGEQSILKNVILLLNSKLINWFFLHKFSDKHLAGGYISINNLMLKQIPLKIITQENNFAIKSNLLRVEYQQSAQKFTAYLQSKFNLKKLTRKMENWFDLSFGEFIKELNKAIKDNNKELVKHHQSPLKELNKIDEMEWMDVFETKKAEVQILKLEINATDKEIDALVYELYGLNNEEIAIVENS